MLHWGSWAACRFITWPVILGLWGVLGKLGHPNFQLRKKRNQQQGLPGLHCWLAWESSHTSHPALQYRRAMPWGVATAVSTDWNNPTSPSGHVRYMANLIILWRTQILHRRSFPHLSLAPGFNDIYINVLYCQGIHHVIGGRPIFNFGTYPSSTQFSQV